MHFFIQASIQQSGEDGSDSMAVAHSHSIQVYEGQGVKSLNVVKLVVGVCIAYPKDYDFNRCISVDVLLNVFSPKMFRFDWSS